MGKIHQFEPQLHGIFRLRVPFESIYTSVFLIRTGEGDLLVDCATTAEDVDGVILPALSELGVCLSEIKMLVLTHGHGDHAGGLARLQEHFPSLEVVTEVKPLFGGLSTYPMAGHTADSIGVLDERTHTLLSGDGLQGAGVDRYRCFTKLPDDYLATLERIRSDGRIENLLFSHAYEPWNSDAVLGRESVEACLAQCKKYVRKTETERGKL